MDGQAGESIGEGRSAGQGKTRAPRSHNWPAPNQKYRIGRVQRQVWRVLTVAGRDLTTSELLLWYLGSSPHARCIVRKAAYRFAERVDGGAREAIWRLRDTK
jgi:hypothetical protein